MFGSLSRSLSNLFSRITGSGKLSEANIQEACGQVFESLIEADVPYEVAESFLAQVKARAIDEKVHTRLKPGEHFIKIVYEQLVQLLGGASTPFIAKTPSILLLLGLQGAGKTTLAGKLAYLAREKQGIKKILLASVDFNRPAAIDQLEQLASRAGVSFFRAPGTNVIDAAREIRHEFESNNYDLLILDTAGRLHVDQPLLDELKQVVAEMKPNYSFLVLDAMTGQESLQVAKAFEAVGYTGVLLTKMDGSAKGGAALAIRHTFNKPILFMGVGEKLDDLEPFHADRIAQRIIGMGDVLSLIEKADAAMRDEEKAKAFEKMATGNLTLEDFAQQLSMLNSMGSLGAIAKYLPGGNKLTDDQVHKAETELKRFKAILSSMTRKERLRPELLNGSRKLRVAKGSGTTPTDVNTLLARFDQSKQFVKLFRQFGKFSRS